MRRSSALGVPFVAVVAASAMLLVACSELEALAPSLERLADALTDEDGQLTEGVTDLVAPRGGTDVTVYGRIEATYDVDGDGLPLYGWQGTVDHEVTGTFGGEGNWFVTRNHATGSGKGYEVCYDPDGGVRNDDWESALHWPGFEPQVELELQGDEVAVLFALDWQIGFDHPGAPACVPSDPTPAGPATTYFSMEVLEGERSPDASTSTRPGIQDGIVVLRIPVDELTAGGTWSGSLLTGGARDGESAALDVALEVTSG